MSSMVATFSETTPSRAVSVMFMILALISYFFCKEGGKCEEDVGQSPLLWYAQKRGGGKREAKECELHFFPRACICIKDRVNALAGAFQVRL